MACCRTFVPFSFGGSADNILYYCSEEQKKKYLIPVINGERRSCFAITEPGAGSDARSIRMSAVKDGGHYMLNGEKTFITNGNEADFAMVFAVTDKAKGAEGGVTCFLVDREMGWRSAYIATMGEWGTPRNCRLSAGTAKPGCGAFLKEPTRSKNGRLPAIC